MNVFIILSILIIVIGVLLIVATPSVLFKLNWNEKTGKEKILMFVFYSILVYIINIVYWIIKWVRGRSVTRCSYRIFSIWTLNKCWLTILRFIENVWKVCVPSQVPWVRIQLSPSLLGINIINFFVNDSIKRNGSSFSISIKGVNWMH